MLIKDEDEFLRANKVTKRNSLMTILQSVYQTQAKKKFSYQIGVATIFMVSAFVTVLLVSSSLTSITFFQMGQTMASDIDYIMTSMQPFEAQINLNQNPYAVNPFDEPGKA